MGECFLWYRPTPGCPGSKAVKRSLLLSTETAILRVLSDILLAVDHGDVAALILLDLLAAFNTVDSEILLQRLPTTYGVSDVAHRWFRSYLYGRSQHVQIGTLCSFVIDLISVVPQGSVLGPVLYILYTASLISLIHPKPWSGLTPTTHRSIARSLPLTAMHSPPSSVGCDDETPAPGLHCSLTGSR